MSSDIFISYAREDRDRVQPIAEALAQRGYGVWWDKGLRSGEDYRDRIEEMLQTAGCVVVVAWSRHSVESDFVIDEAGRGHRRRVLLPVFIDQGIEPPLGFGGIHTSDLSGWLRDPSDPGFEQFVGDVAAVVGREASPAAPPPPAPAAGARTRRPGLLPFAIGGGALLLATTGVYLSSRTLSSVGSDVTPTQGMDTAGLATVEDSAPAPAAPATPAAALANLTCSLPTVGSNPLESRRQELVRPPFSVDTTRHLLLDENGSPVPGGAAARVGTLRSRRMIVAHFTGGPEGAGERWLQTQEAGGSLHLIIGGAGNVRQLLPFDYASIHAGRSRWQDLENISFHSIGIGMDNLGPLRRRDGEWYFSNTMRVPAASVMVVADSTGVAQGWHRYTDAQVRAFFHVSCALRRAYPTIEHLVGHGDVSRSPRVEPGPAFPLDAVRSRLFPER